MIRPQPFVFDQITPFVCAGFAAAFVTTILLLYVYAFRREFFMRPSMIMAGLFNLFYQWPLVVFSRFYEVQLPQPFMLLFLTAAPALVALISVMAFPARSLSGIWGRIGALQLASPADKLSQVQTRRWILAGIIAVSVGLLATYLSYVPFDCTGLYALIFDTDKLAALRELSLKLLDPPLPRYAFSLFASVTAPLICVFTVSQCGDLLVLKRYKEVLFWVLVLIVTALAMLLPGAKGLLINMTLVIMLTLLWRVRLYASIIRLAAYVVLPLLPALAVVMVIWLGQYNNNNPGAVNEHTASCVSRMQVSPSANETLKAYTPSDEPQLAQDQVGTAVPPNFVIGAVQIVLNRAFGIPIHVASWYTHYTQTQNPIGTAGIRQLAELTDKTLVDLPNVIGRTYEPGYVGRAVIETVSATTGFMFSYYAYFGLMGVVFALVFVLMLDGLVFLMRWLDASLLLAYMVTLTCGMFRLIQSDLGVSLLSHGFIPSILAIFGIQIMLNLKNRISKKGT